MSLFDSPAPRLFAVAPGVDFVDAFARGLNARMGRSAPQAAARVAVMVNTRRWLRAIEEALVEAASRPVDWVMSAIVGAAGLRPTLARRKPPVIGS
mgnify:CR=1 FL=1